MSQLVTRTVCCLRGLWFMVRVQWFVDLATIACVLLSSQSSIGKPPISRFIGKYILGLLLPVLDMKLSLLVLLELIKEYFSYSQYFSYQSINYVTYINGCNVKLLEQANMSKSILRYLRF